MDQNNLKLSTGEEVDALDVMDHKIVDQVVTSPDVPEQTRADALDVLDKKVQSAELQGPGGVESARNEEKTDKAEKTGSDFD